MTEIKAPAELQEIVDKLNRIINQVIEGYRYDTVQFQSSLSYIKFLLSAYQISDPSEKQQIRKSLEEEVELLRLQEKRSPTYFVSGETTNGMKFSHEVYGESQTEVLNKINALYQVKLINDLYFIGMIEPSRRLNPLD